MTFHDDEPFDGDEPNPFRNIRRDRQRLRADVNEATASIVDHAVGLRLATTLNDPRRAREELASLRSVVDTFTVPNEPRAW